MADERREVRPEDFTLRCLWVDYARPSEEAGEMHWRCPTRFAYHVLPDTRHMAIYCGAHSDNPLGLRHSDLAMVDRVVGRPVQQQGLMAQGRARTAADDALTDEDLVRLRAHR